MSAENGNTASSPEPKIIRTELRLHMDATVSVVDPATRETTDWLKPGAEVAYWWDGVPSVDEVAKRYVELSNIVTTTMQREIVTQIKAKAELERERLRIRVSGS